VERGKTARLGVVGMNIDEMPAGRQMDALIAEKIMILEFFSASLG